MPRARLVAVVQARVAGHVREVHEEPRRDDAARAEQRFRGARTLVLPRREQQAHPGEARHGSTDDGRLGQRHARIFLARVLGGLVLVHGSNGEPRPQPVDRGRRRPTRHDVEGQAALEVRHRGQGDESTQCHACGKPDADALRQRATIV